MKPIIFNTEMVKAILEGRKTQTRRPIKPQPINIKFINNKYKEVGNDDTFRFEYKQPYKVGDILYVRETWAQDDENSYMYRANDFNQFTPKWKPSIHMPREAARLFLKVTNVRVERVQNISSNDAWEEGFECTCMRPVPQCAGNIISFSKTWNSIYKNWDDNPWVWVFDFEVTKRGNV
jgi:hypothetical protein